MGIKLDFEQRHRAEQVLAEMQDIELAQADAACELIYLRDALLTIRNLVAEHEGKFVTRAAMKAFLELLPNAKVTGAEGVRVD